MSITTEHGTTVSIEDRDGERLVILDNPDSPPEMRGAEAGRMIDGGFQPHPFANFLMRPAVLRAIADLMERDQ